MEKFQLSLFTIIQGVGATSGLVYRDNSIFIISDNSTFLYEYNINEKTLDKIKLFQNSQENTAKKDKADFESIALLHNKIHLFGSGSTKKRNRKVVFDIESKEIKEKNLSKTYKKLRETVALAEDELNIEGVIISETTTYFFQRGNGAMAKNGIFVFNKEENIQFIAFELPAIQHCATTFTDAILIEDTIYFLAAAENTTSTYNDGEVLGSSIGKINLKTMTLESCFLISDKHKFEGLTVYKKTATHIELLLCEDNDTEELVSSIYKIILEL